MILRKQSDRFWRWAALVAVFLNVMFSYLSGYFMPGNDIGVVTEKYNSLFAPAGYAFLIWGIIYLSFFCYAVYQLMPSQRRETLFDCLAKPFIGSNLLGMVWISVYRMDFISISTVVILFMLTLAVILYVRVRHVVLRNEQSSWLSLPFSLFLGWLSVAAIANVDILLISLGWMSDLPTQLTTTMVFILVAGLSGVFISYRCADFIFTSVISWACVAIFVAHGNAYYSIGAVALMSASLPLVWFILTLSKRIIYRHRVLANKFSFDATIRLKLNGQNKLLFGRL